MKIMVWWSYPALIAVTMLLVLANGGVCSSSNDTFRDMESFFNTTLCSTYTYNYFCSLGVQQQDWFYFLYQSAMTEMTQNRPRIRKEVRSLTDKEWTSYNAAVQALKHDTSIPPNRYEALALIHTNQTLCSVHRGTNFLGWHRVYLLVFETALRQKDSTVTLPYWDSVLDNNNITNPDHIVVFTDRFFGNGRGNVLTGPYRNWVNTNNCPLTRDIANNDTHLMSPEIINSLQNDLTIHHMHQIIYSKDSNSSYSIEGQHNDLHDWVGGFMGILGDAPQDPIFFLHHAFIDYTWEKFRMKQQKKHVDPETEYPIISNRDVRRHYPHRPMDCFYWITNIDGLSNNFSKIVVYEESPRCPHCGNSVYLTCNTVQNRCISIPDVLMTSTTRKLLTTFLNIFKKLIRLNN